MNLTFNLPTIPDWTPLEIAFQNASLPTELVLQFMWMYEDENSRHYYKAIDSRRYLIVSRRGQPLVKTEWGMQAVPSIAPLLADVLPPFCRSCGCTRNDVLFMANRWDTGDPICCEVAR